MLQQSFNDGMTGNTLMRRSQRKPKVNSQPALKLERVIGFTTTSICTHPHQDILAYPSGCTTVLFDSKKHTQGPFLIGTLSTASPELVTNTSATPSTSKSDNFIPPKSIVSMAFSPDGKYLAVGEAGRNPRVLIWDLETKKYTSELKGHKFGVLALTFSPDQKYLVSIGYQHDGIINVWNWKRAIKMASNRVSSKVNGLIFSSDGTYFVTVGLRHVRFWYFNHNKTSHRDGILEGRSGILGSFNNKNFLDGVFDEHSLFVITSDGFLCKLNESRKIHQTVNLKVNGAISLGYYDNKLAVGCTDGTTKIFNCREMKLITSIPKPHQLGEDLNQVCYPDTVAVKFNFDGTKLINMFSDRSIYIFDITSFEHIHKIYSSLFHSDGIWGSGLSTKDELSTCSSDGTIRFWNLDGKSDEKLLYLDKDAPLRYQQISTNESNPLWGVRSVKFTPDAKYIISGDRTGNLRVHDMSNLKLITYQEAHDSEIMDIDVNQDETGYYIATGSRDRTSHIFKMSLGKFNLVQTLEDHSSSITSVKFINQANNFISCSADKSIIFRTNTGTPHYTSFFNHCNRATFTAMVADENNGIVIAVSQDKHIHKLCARTGKLLKLIKVNDPNGDVGLTRVALDNSGQYACVAGTDKGIRIVDLISNQLLGSVYGHSEMITSVNFSSDCSRIISTSGDGCIFIWKLNIDLFTKIRNQSQNRELSHSNSRNPSTRSKTQPPINQTSTINNLNYDEGVRQRAFSQSAPDSSNSRWGRKIEKNGISIVGSSLASRSQIKLNEFRSKEKNQAEVSSSESIDSFYESSVLEEVDGISEIVGSPAESIYSPFSINATDCGYESGDILSDLETTNYKSPMLNLLSSLIKEPTDIPSPKLNMNEILPNTELDHQEIATMSHQLQLAQLIIKELHESYHTLKLHQLTPQDPPEKYLLLSKFNNLSVQLSDNNLTSLSIETEKHNDDIKTDSVLLNY